MNVEIAQRLAELRRTKGYSQESLAHELGLSRQAVSKWERAESSPDTENLIALARLYGVSLDDLLRVDADVAEDIAYERAARADERATDERLAQATQDAADEERRAHQEAVMQAAAAATQASEAASRAAQAAAQASQQATHATAEAAGRHAKGRWRSFPYGILMIPLWFVLTIAGAAPFSFLVFFSIPVYRWLAGIMDSAEQREAPAPEAAPTEAAAVEQGAGRGAEDLPSAPWEDGEGVE